MAGNEQQDTRGTLNVRELRGTPMADLKERLALQFILPSDRETLPARPHGRLALVLHLYYADLAEYCFRYALSMPPESDIFITTDSPEKQARVEEIFRRGPWQRVETILIENRGRDVSALLVGAAPILRDYDLVCFVHDKKAAQLSCGLTGADFSERCFSNLLASPAYVKNLLSLFAERPQLGMLMPPPPMHGSYYCTLGVEWSSNFENTLALHRSLGLGCPISADKEPVSPLGTMFWFRPAALKKLLDRGWTYQDFPPEPNGEDGTLLHAIERLYGFVAQDAGYTCGWVMTERGAQEELEKLRRLRRELLERAERLPGFLEQDRPVPLRPVLGRLLREKLARRKTAKTLEE